MTRSFGQTAPQAQPGRQPVFIYYFAQVEKPFSIAYEGTVGLFGRFNGWAEDAYRSGEDLSIRIGLGGRDSHLAKEVLIGVGPPSMGPNQATIPIEWEASGTPGLFPSMHADLVLSGLGDNLTQVALRGSYEPPLGILGRLADRALLHRVAESSIKGFVDRIVAALEEMSLPTGE